VQNEPTAFDGGERGEKREANERRDGHLIGVGDALRALLKIGSEADVRGAYFPRYIRIRCDLSIHRGATVN
jgi:hypothetical protein